MATKPFLSQIAVPVGTTTGDVYYPQTSLLMHFNGTNVSTTMTDNSKNNTTVTSVNGAAISTAQSKFGGTSGLFDGTNDYIQVATSANLAFGTGAFTIEMWVYRNTSGAGPHLMDFRGANNNDYNPVFYWGSNNFLYYTNNNTSGDNQIQTSNAITSASGWVHLALVRSGTTLTIYINGVESGNTSYSTDVRGGNPVFIGSRFNLEGYFNGYIDELRITKGIARYTGNFTPSTTQFLDSAGDANSSVVVNSTATGFAIGTGGINGAQLAKAWVNFNGTGTVAIRDSYSVSSITDLDTGNYRVNFSSTFSTIPTVVASTSNEATNTNYGVNVNSHTTSTVQIYCTENGATTDKSVVSVIVFRN